MKSSQDFWNSVHKIVTYINDNEDDITTAELVQYKKELRLIKKEAVETRKLSNAVYENQKTNSNSGCLSLLLGRGYARSVNASNKRNIQNQKLRTSNLYDQVIRQIDSCLAQIDILKSKKSLK